MSEKSIKNKFEHRALHLKGDMPIVFTALSKRRFYMRMLICKFVLEQNKTPLNPFMVFDYFLTDSVDRDTVRKANNGLVARSDELWIFGEVSNGVLAEILQAKELSMPIRYFAIDDDREISEIMSKDVIFEQEVADRRGEL